MQPKEHDFHGFLHSATLVEEELRRQLAPLGLHPRQARVLVAMKHMEPVSQVELAETFGITPASMSTMTDRLLAAGFITRQADPNTRRRNVLELTDAGRAKLDAVIVAWDAVDEIAREILGPENAQTLFSLSRRLRKGLGGSPPGRRPDHQGGP